MIALLHRLNYSERLLSLHRINWHRKPCVISPEKPKLYRSRDPFIRNRFRSLCETQ